MGIESPLASFYLDRAVAVFGRAVEEDIESKAANRKTASAKKMATTVALNTWLQTTSGFRDPMAGRS